MLDLKKLLEEAINYGDITRAILAFCDKKDITIEVIDNEIYEDSDFEEMLISLGYSITGKILAGDLSYAHTEIEGCSKDSDYVIISNEENMFLVPFRDETNRFDETYPDETLYNFEGIVMVPMDNADKCDECLNYNPKAVLINLHPDGNESDENLKLEYKDYNGMVCPSCYHKMCHND